MRPITKEDVKYWKTIWKSNLKVKYHPVLGIIVLINDQHWAYASETHRSSPKCVSKRTLERRKKLGFPNKRKMKPKQMLQDGLFSLDEMAIAEAIINGG